jgi:hypothetical protein
VNCSEIRSVTSSVFIHPLFAFRRRSPQLILRLYYVWDWGIFYARWQHVAQYSRAATSKPTCANILSIIAPLLASYARTPSISCRGIA